MLNFRSCSFSVGKEKWHETVIELRIMPFILMIVLKFLIS